MTLPELFFGEVNILGRNNHAGHGNTAKENICLHAEGLYVAATGFLGKIRFAVVFPVVSHNHRNVLNITTAQPPDHLPDTPLAHGKWVKMFSPCVWVFYQEGVPAGPFHFCQRNSTSKWLRMPPCAWTRPSRLGHRVPCTFLQAQAGPIPSPLPPEVPVAARICRSWEPGGSS